MTGVDAERPARPPGPGEPDGTGPSRSAPARRTAALALALAGGTLLLYAQVAGFEFVRFDDNRYLTDNLHVQRGLSWAGLAWAFTTLHASNWHPLTWLSHMLDVELFGLDAGAHHLVNAALHAADAALVFLALTRLTGARWRSLAVAALFAVHPLHVESVAWVAERKDVLSTLLGLLALLAYARHAERPSRRTLGAVALAFAASLLAKPMWVTLPFLLLLLDVWPLRRIAGIEIGGGDPGGSPARPPLPLRRILLEKVPLLALSAASSVVTVIAQERGGSLSGLDLPVPVRLANAAVSYLGYVRRTFWPVDLAAFYPYAPVGAFEAFGAGTLLLAATALVVWRARAAPWLAVGWLWFLGTLVPVIGIVQVGGQALADRYTYLPLVGLFVMVVWGADRLVGAWRGGVPLAATGAAAVLALSALSARQIATWSDNETLFRHALAVTQDNALAHGALSDGLRTGGRLEEALLHAREAVRIDPGSARHWNNLAVLLVDLGRPPEAREAVVRALDLNPAYALAWTTLGIVEQDLGNLPAAEVALLRATALAPGDPQAWFRLGLIRSQAGRWPEAAQAYEETVRLAPNHLGGWTNLAVARQGLGRTAEAARAFEAAARADPSSFAAWRNLGVFLAKGGRPAEAIAPFREALRLRPGDADVLFRLGMALATAGAGAEALEVAAKLEAVNPAAAAEVRARAAGGR